MQIFFFLMHKIPFSLAKLQQGEVHCYKMGQAGGSLQYG